MPLETGNVSPQTSSTGGNAVTGAGLGEGGSEGAEGSPLACQVKGLKGGRSILQTHHWSTVDGQNHAPPGMIKTL